MKALEQATTMPNFWKKISNNYRDFKIADYLNFYCVAYKKNECMISFRYVYVFSPIFAANYPQWIPYALIGSTGISLPLVLLVKEEYNRSAIDSGDATPDNESNPNAVH